MTGGRLVAMDTMTATQVVFATVVATQLWRKIQLAHQNVVDLDDIKQVALLEVWLIGLECPEMDWEARGTYEVNVAWTRVTRRAIDHLRVATGLGKKLPDGSFPRPSPRSLDEPTVSGSDGKAVTLSEILPDPHASEPFEQIEDAHDIAHAFASHRGSAREAEVAALHLEGYTLAEIGAHYGVTEARACQLRRAFVERVREDWREDQWYAEHGAIA